MTDTPFPRPLLPVGVRIGGRVADVTYAGAAPGLVAGMLQVNARVPADTPRGTNVPVQIIDRNSDQSAERVSGYKAVMELQLNEMISRGEFVASLPRPLGRRELCTDCRRE